MSDLQAKSPVTLTRAELLTLLPGAKMTRTTDKGNMIVWTNEPSGEMIVSSDNRATATGNSTAPGKWHISEDGRFCLNVQWKKMQAEDSCRFILKTSDGYYGASALEPETRKAYRLTIVK
jgi:hypothetical protein